MKAQIYLLAIALLGFSVLLVPSFALGITPSTTYLFVGETPIGTCVSAPLSMTNEAGVPGSVDDYVFLYSSNYDFDSPPPFPVVLGPGESVDFLVEFCLDEESFDMGEILFGTSSGDITVYLNGLGLPPVEDSDGDGVPNSTDNCISTPNGEFKRQDLNLKEGML